MLELLSVLEIQPLRKQEVDKPVTFIIRGEPSPKLVAYQAKPVLVTTCLIAERNNFALAGIVDGELHTTLWGGLPEPVQGWRSFQLAQRLPIVDNFAYYACWELAQTDPAPGNYNHWLDNLAQRIGSEQRSQEIIDTIPYKLPTGEIENIIRTVRDAHITVSYHGLRTAVRVGQLDNTPLIKGIILQGEAKARRDYKKLQEEERVRKIEMERVIDSKESFTLLLEQLEIDGVVLGIPFGAYGLDWGVTDVMDVDRSIVHLSFYDRKKYGELLFCLRGKPKLLNREEVGPGIIQGVIYTGEPQLLIWYDKKTGYMYTIKRARYDDGRFFLTIELEHLGAEKIEKTLTVAQLRDQIEFPL